MLHLKITICITLYWQSNPSRSPVHWILFHFPYPLLFGCHCMWSDEIISPQPSPKITLRNITYDYRSIPSIQLLLHSKTLWSNICIRYMYYLYIYIYMCICISVVLSAECWRSIFTRPFSSQLTLDQTPGVCIWWLASACCSWSCSIADFPSELHLHLGCGFPS